MQRNGTTVFVTEMIRTGLLVAAIGWNLLATIKLKEDVAALRVLVEGIHATEKAPTPR